MMCDFPRSIIAKTICFSSFFFLIVRSVLILFPLLSFLSLQVRIMRRKMKHKSIRRKSKRGNQIPVGSGKSPHYARKRKPSRRSKHRKRGHSRRHKGRSKESGLMRKREEMRNDAVLRFPQHVTVGHRVRHRLRHRRRHRRPMSKDVHIRPVRN